MTAPATAIPQTLDPARRNHLAPMEDDDLKRLAGEYMQERFGWVSDTTQELYICRYAQVLEAMMYLRDRERMAVKVIVQLKAERRMKTRRFRIK